MNEDKIAAVILLGPLILLTAPIWIPTLLAVKLLKVMWSWIE